MEQIHLSSDVGTGLNRTRELPSLELSFVRIILFFINRKLLIRERENT